MSSSNHQNLYPMASFVHNNRTGEFFRCRSINAALSGNILQKTHIIKVFWHILIDESAV